MMRLFLTLLFFVVLVHISFNIYAQQKPTLNLSIPNLKYQEAQYDSCLFYIQELSLGNNKINNEFLLQSQELKSRCLIKLGLLEKAQHILDSLVLLPIIESNTALKAQIGLNKSELLLAKGYTDEALEENKIAEKYILNNPQLAALSLAIYSQRSIIYWNQSNIETALEYAYKSLEISRYEIIKQKDPVQEARMMNNIGLILQGDRTEESHTYYMKSKYIYDSLGYTSQVEYANLLNNIALSLKAKNQEQEALEKLSQVLEIRRKIYPETHRNIAFVYATKARLYFESAAIEMAEIEIQKAIVIYETLYGNKHPEISGAYNLLAEIYLSYKKENQAIAFAHKALLSNIRSNAEGIPIFKNPNLSEVIQPELYCASLLLKSFGYRQKFINKSLKLNDLKYAINALVYADTLIWRLKNRTLSKNDKIRLSKWSSEIYLGLIQNHLDLAKYSKKFKDNHEQALIYSERNKASVLTAAIAETQSKHFAGIPDSLLDKENQLKKEIAYLEKELAEHGNEATKQRFINQLFVVDNNYRNLIQSLEKNYPKYYELKYKRDENLKLSSIQNKLKPNQALFSFTWDESQKMMYTFVITKQKMRVYSQYLNEDLEKEIAGMRNGMIFHSMNTYKKSAYQIYRLLFKNKLPPNTKQIFWIPDGKLNMIPIEALLQKKDVHITDYAKLSFLVKKIEVAQHFSISLLYREDQPNIYQNQICLLAPVVFQNQQGKMGSNLPGSLEEVNQIAQLFDNEQLKNSVFTHSKASESLVKTGVLDNTKYIHLATHGLVDEHRPELSKIILPEDNERKEDGILYSGEIYNLKLNCELVTLSACQTGLGKITKGEGMVGLSRSLIYAGAKNIMVSLWSVSDQSTSVLMRNFYKHLVHEKPSNFSKSLAVAKRKLIEENNYADPYFWAAFTLLGK